MPKSKIFFFCLIAFIAGVGVSSYIFVSEVFIFSLFVVGIVIFVSLFRRLPIFWVGLYIICFVLGVVRHQASIILFDFTPHKSIVAFEGIIVERPSVRVANTQLVLSHIVFEGSDEGVPKDFKILIFAPHYPKYQYGDRVFVQARLRVPGRIESFDYQAYLLRKNIYLTGFPEQITFLEAKQGNSIKQFLFSVRDWFEEAIQQTISEPHSAFLNGLLLGASEQLPRDISDSFRATGLSHIVALSGYNITIIGNFFLLLFLWFGVSRKKSFWFVVIGICAFVVFTGAEASVVRAAVMGILVLLAYQLGRMYNIRNALAFAAVVMLFINPKLLSFDVSFQLSFLATLGLVYLAPRLETLFKKIPETFQLREYMNTTLSAQFAVLPILLYRFSDFSLIAPLANILVLPVIPIAMLVGFLVSITGVFFPFLGVILNIIAWPFLEWPLFISGMLSRIPLASFYFEFGVVAVLLYIFILWRWVSIEPKDEQI